MTSAVNGSRRDARLAGRYAARTAATRSKRAATAVVTGSVAVKPKNIDSTEREAAQASGTPASAPKMTSRIASLTTMPMTVLLCAPSAMRIPISVVRRATLYASKPYRPTDARMSASTPNPLASVAIIRSRIRAASTCSESPRISNAAFGSRVFSSSRRTVAT